MRKYIIHKAKNIELNVPEYILQALMANTKIKQRLDWILCHARRIALSTVLLTFSLLYCYVPKIASTIFHFCILILKVWKNTLLILIEENISKSTEQSPDIIKKKWKDPNPNTGKKMDGEIQELLKHSLMLSVQKW